MASWENKYNSIINGNTSVLTESRTWSAAESTSLKKALINKINAMNCDDGAKKELTEIVNDEFDFDNVMYNYIKEIYPALNKQKYNY